MSNSVRPHRWQPIRLPRPWDSPGKNAWVGCHFLLQCMKVKSESESEVAQLCPTLQDPMDCSLPGASVHSYWYLVHLFFFRHIICILSLRLYLKKVSHHFYFLLFLWVLRSLYSILLALFSALAILLLLTPQGFPGGSEVKNPHANAGDVGSIPGSGRSPGEWNGNPLQYSWLGNPMDRGAWWATVHGVTKE